MQSSRHRNSWRRHQWKRQFQYSSIQNISSILSVFLDMTGFKTSASIKMKIIRIFFSQYRWGIPPTRRLPSEYINWIWITKGFLIVRKFQSLSHSSPFINKMHKNLLSGCLLYWKKATYFVDLRVNISNSRNTLIERYKHQESTQKTQGAFFSCWV